VNNGSRIYRMDLPDTEVKYSTGLHKKLVEILGANAVTVVNASGTNYGIA
jgi:hypothetical protein